MKKIVSHGFSLVLKSCKNPLFQEVTHAHPFKTEHQQSTAKYSGNLLCFR